jgi:hypothetical protein
MKAELQIPFEEQIENLVKRSAGEFKNSTVIKSNFARLAKMHERNRVKGFAEKYSGKLRQSNTTGMKILNKNRHVKPAAAGLAKKGKPGIRLFQLALNRSMPAIEKELAKIGMK